MTMLTFDTADPKSCGIVQKDKDGRVIEFYEKNQIKTLENVLMEQYTFLITNLQKC